MYYNRWPYIDYLIEMSKSADSESLLLENLFIMLSSLDMIALTRTCAILHFAFILPMHWLAGKTHELAKYNWLVDSMGCVYDILHEKLSIIKTDRSKFLDEEFDMKIFDNLSQELSPFADHLEYIFEMKENTTADGKKNVLPADLIRCELFYPTRTENQESTELVKKLAEEVANV